jgi:hypothetical protein
MVTKHTGIPDHKFIPFSNSTEYELWTYKNCDRCLQTMNDCPGEESLLDALMDDGKISPEICDFIGTTDRHTQDNGYSFCTLNQVCNHFQPHK